MGFVYVASPVGRRSGRQWRGCIALAFSVIPVDSGCYGVFADGVRVTVWVYCGLGLDIRRNNAALATGYLAPAIVDPRLVKRTYCASVVCRERSRSPSVAAGGAESRGLVQTSDLALPTDPRNRPTAAGDFLRGEFAQRFGPPTGGRSPVDCNGWGIHLTRFRRKFRRGPRVFSVLRRCPLTLDSAFGRRPKLAPHHYPRNPA